MSLRTAILIQFFLFAFNIGSYAQHPINYNLKIGYGFVMDHSQNMTHLADQRPFRLSSDIYFNTSGTKEWHSLYKFPEAGVSLHYFTMDKEKPLGNMLGIIPYFQKSFLRTKKSELGFRLGMGMGLTGKRFHPVNNYKNNLISSFVSFAFNGSFNYKYYFSEKLYLLTEISLVHFSNGAVKIPNLGINLPTINAGIGFDFQPRVLNNKKSSSKIDHKKINILIPLALGLKEAYPIDGKKYLIFATSVFSEAILNKKSKVNLGIDFFYDASTEKYLIKNFLPLEKRNYYKAGIAIGHSLAIAKLDIITQIGFYFHDPVKNYNRSYQRIGIRYWMVENLGLGLALKTHLGNADFVEWTTTIRF